ncbi:primosome assembly protein PriA, partial [Streptomyces sp. NPDC002454]
VAGPPEAVAEFLALVELPADAVVLGPVPMPAPGVPGGPPSDRPWERALLRVPPGSGGALAAALKSAQAARTARGTGGGSRVEVRVDPPDIG